MSRTKTVLSRSAKRHAALVSLRRRMILKARLTPAVRSALYPSHHTISGDCPEHLFSTDALEFETAGLLVQG